MAARPCCAWLWLAAAVLVPGPRPAAFAADQETSKPQRLFQYNAEGHRDPFMPLVRDGKPINVQGVMTGTAQPVLYGILWDPHGASLALINDSEVKVGDVIGTYRVTEIRQDAVVLANGSSPLVLQISFDTPPPSGAKGGEGR